MKTKETVLKEVFGYDTFRLGQDVIIETILDETVPGVLCIMPTGGGKSLLYQIPAIIKDGLNVVVSPLISLMKDQVDTLIKKGVQVGFYNSSLTTKEKTEVINQINLGIMNILYVAPERFDDEDFVTLLKVNGINIFAVDEAHGISMAGPDFRPAYRRLKSVIDKVKPKQVVAVTATATPIVQNDICEQLGIPNAKKFIMGFYRDNLAIRVQEDDDRMGTIAKQVRDYAYKGIETGIVYAGTRANAETITEYLKKDYSVPATFYHAGLSSDKRTEVQDKWSKDGGIIVATCAFGMGIDKPDVRFVIHCGLPGNLEAWYQEIGRAGRDGKTSVCRLYWDMGQDYRLQNYFINLSCPPEDTVTAFWEWLNKEALVSDEITMTQAEMAEASGIDPGFISGCVSVVRSSGLLQSEKRGVYKVFHQSDGGASKLNLSSLTKKRKDKKDRLKEMISFAKNTKVCRMIQILNYFGDRSHSKPCGKCDVCFEKSS